MLSIEQYDDLISLIYECAYDASKWPEFLFELSDVLDGNYLAFHGYDLKAGLNFGTLAARYDPERLRLFEEYYAQINPWLPKLAELPTGSARRAESFLERDVLLKSEFYADWLKPQEDIATGGGIVLFREADRMLVLSGNLRLRDPADKQDELIKTLQLVGPHLQRAFRLLRRLDLVRSAHSSFATSLDGSRHALFIVDHDCSIQYLNPAAEQMLARTGAIRVSETGQLEIGNSDLQSHLEKCVRQISNRSWGFQGLPIKVPIDGWEDWFEINVDPLPLHDREAVKAIDVVRLAEPVALVTIDRPRGRLDKQANAFGEKFDLTSAETSLLINLLLGLKLYEHAQLRGISPNTARNQLQSITMKTGVHSQVELLALFARWL
jgi:DNA-binding CsgD family transcriptional regulator/PAS domain-containing protein